MVDKGVMYTEKRIGPRTEHGGMRVSTGMIAEH